MLAGLLLVVATLVTLARVMSVPYPIFLVLGGLAIGFVPGMPDVELDPELVLLIFLPPLLYSSAFFASLRDLRRNVGPISLLSGGLVLLTCGAVAVVVHAVVPGMSWAAAFVLGAIVSPTDPVAATAIAGRIGVPRRGRRGHGGDVQRLGGRRAVRARRRGRPGRRPGGGLGRRVRARAAGRPAGGDHDLALHRVRRVPPGRGAGPLRRRRRRHRRPVHGLADQSGHER